MLRRTKHLLNGKVFIGDTWVGTIRDFIFDSNSWQITHLLIRVRDGWLSRQSVFIQPKDILKICEATDTDHHVISVSIYLSMTQHQLRTSRILKSTAFDYYHWPYFWTGVGVFGAAATSDVFRDGILPDLTEEAVDTSSLRSLAGTIDFHVKSIDADIGYLEDVLRDTNWKIQYWVVHARHLHPNRSLLLSHDWIKTIDWDDVTIHVPFSEICMDHSPPFDPHPYSAMAKPTFEDTKYEEDLRHYYDEATKRLIEAEK